MSPIQNLGHTAFEDGVDVAATSTLIIAANAARTGLEVINDGPSDVYLGRDGVADIGEGLMLTPGGSWDGKVSGTVWIGAVHAICETGDGHVTVSEDS